MAGAQGRGTMILLLIVAALIGVWAWRSGQWRAIRFADVAALVAGLGAVRMISQGNWPFGALAGAGAAAWFWRRRALIAPAASIPTDEALRLLDLPPGADAEAIRAAHRRIAARVHPDAGGSAELAARVNAARDSLLADLAARKRD